MLRDIEFKINIGGTVSVWEIFQKIFKNEIMYYVIVPISILIFEWINNWYEIKNKSKKMGYWKIRIRREPSFYTIMMNSYILMTVNLLIMVIIKYISSFWIDEILSFTIISIIYVIVNILIIVYIIKRPKTKIALLTERRTKQVLIGILWFIFSIIFFLEIIPKYKYIIEIIIGIVLIRWFIYLSKYINTIFILDKSYADVYINGTEAVKCVYAGSMRKKGGWIYVVRNVEGLEEEIRIKESEITRIDYYGDPIYIQIDRKND